jgi:hypothetical protein
MNQVVLGGLFAIGLFFGSLFMMQLGRYIRGRQSGKDIESKRAGLSVIEGALFGLMGLILAFSSSGAGIRFDARRQLIIDEANCIGTAYLRLELFPAQAKQALQEKFRQYVDALLATYRAIPDITKAQAEMTRAETIQNEIWAKAIEASQQMSSNQATQLLVLPALNEMFDIANTCYRITQMHTPFPIYLLMSVLLLICSLLAGYSMGESKERSWIHAISFAALLSLTLYVIIDLDFPRLGRIQVRDFDQAIIDIRDGMSAETATIHKK